MPGQLLTYEEGAIQCNMSVKFLKKMVALGKLRVVKFSKNKVRIRPAELERFIDRMTA